MRAAPPVREPFGLRRYAAEIVKVLIVDDHAETRQLVRRNLEADGHIVHTAGSCQDARAALDRHVPEVMILDVMLPDGSGMDLCRSLREAGVITPVLLLTARGDVRDRVAGLDAGADDYLAKPFAVSELLARVRALARRGPALRAPVLASGEIIIDLQKRKVTRAGAVVLLTARELAIVEVLARKAGGVVPRDELVEAVWGESTESALASLEVLIARIRRKLGGAAAPLRTIRSLGYVLDVEG